MNLFNEELVTPFNFGTSTCVNFGFFSDCETLWRIYTFECVSNCESALKDQSKKCAAFSVSHLKLPKTVN